MVLRLKHEVHRGALNTVSVRWPECTLEVMRAAVATGFISQAWLGPGTGAFAYDPRTEQEDEAVEDLDVQVFQDKGTSVGAKGALLMASRLRVELLGFSA